MTTSLKEETHTSVSIYLLYLHLADKEEPHHELAFADLDDTNEAEAKFITSSFNIMAMSVPGCQLLTHLFPPRVTERPLAAEAGCGDRK